MKKGSTFGFTLLLLGLVLLITLLREGGRDLAGKSGSVLSRTAVEPVVKTADSEPKTREPLANLDVRTRAGAEVVLNTGRVQKLAEFKKSLPDTSVDFDPVTKSPRWIGSTTRLLTEPQPVLAAQDADAPIRQFIAAHRILFGHGPEVLDSARRVTDYSTARGPSRKVVWHQQLDGIEIFEAILQANLTTNSALINIGSQMMPEPEKILDAATRAILAAKPPVAVEQAVAASGANVGEKIDADGVRPMAPPAAQPDKRQQFRAAMLTDAEAKLIWVPMDEKTLRLAWDVTLTSRTRAEMYRVLVDAQTSAVLVRQALTAYISPASYRVYTQESPTPFSPGHETPSSLQPLPIARELITLDALNTTASPNGWINDGINITSGNNTDTYTDTDNTNTPDLPRTTGIPNRVFDFPLDLTQAPASFKDASNTQLFYWTNFMHDRMYQLGFTEAAGNFQIDNFGRGGIGNDPVNAEAQDGSGTDNANFSTPVDGGRGRMQMYLWTSPTPDRDGSFEAEVVLHEYGHGVSNRLVGGPSVSISNLSSRGMGEGWSDFYGLALTAEATDDPHGNWARGGWSRYLSSGWLSENYYYGARRYSYSTDTLKNPHTLRDIDPNQVDWHTSVPRNPTYAATQDATQVHYQGTVWCTMLWDLRANLILKHGFTIGNERALFLVTEGMKYGPANPNFVQSRNGIVQAALVNHPGDLGEVWTAFAKRGMGDGATAPVSTTTTGIVESYTVPDSLEISDRSGWNIRGVKSGPFTPAAQTLTLSNDGTAALDWTATPNADWLTISPSSGTLAAGANVVVTVTTQANGVEAGFHSTNVVFTNSTTAFNQPVGVRLYVIPPVANSFDLSTNPGWTTTGEWAFGTPTGGGGAAAGGSGMVDPTSGATGSNVFGVNLSGNAASGVSGPFYLTSAAVDLSLHKNTRLRFMRWLNADVLSNTRLTVEVSVDGTNWREVYVNPGQITTANAWTLVDYDISSIADRQAAVQVRWGYQNNSSANTYSGWNIDDIQLLGEVTAQLSLAFNTDANEGTGPLAATLSINAAQPTPVAVTLTSSDPTAATVPATITLDAGVTSVPFFITLVNDALLDGTQPTLISASAPVFVSAAQALRVHDDETATLTLNMPALMAEGATGQTGSISVSSAPGRDVTVALSSDNAALSVPASALIPAGSTGPVNFTFSTPDNALAEGGKAALVTASVTNWTPAIQNVQITDDDVPVIMITGPSNGREGNGLSAFTAAVNTVQASALTLTLTSDDTSELIVPATVVIPAGALSENFIVTVVNDTLKDGVQTATITGSRVGYLSGTRAVSIADNDAASYAFAAIPSPQKRSKPFPIVVTARDINGVTIMNHGGNVNLTSTSGAGPVPFFPTRSDLFVDGVTVENIAVSGAATGMSLIATDAGGNTGTSNAFDVEPVVHDSFLWSGLPTGAVVADTLFSGTATAVDDLGGTDSSYAESTTVDLWLPAFDRTLGTDTLTTSRIYNTAAHDSRAQMIFTAAELGSRPRWISGIGFSRAATGGSMSNAYLRIKHTDRADFVGAGWEGSGWQTAYTVSSLPASTTTINFTRPFFYDGVRNLMMDFSFNGTSASTAGTLFYTSRPNRLLSSSSNSLNGDPLQWSGFTGSNFEVSDEVPNVMFFEALNFGAIPASPVAFSAGIWTGQAYVPRNTVNSSFWLRALAPSGVVGFSNRLTIGTVSAPVGTSTVLTETFESGILGAAWNITGNSGTTPRTLVTTANSSRAGLYHLTMDNSNNTAGVVARNAPTLTLNLAGRSNVSVEWYAKSFSDEGHFVPLTGPVGTFGSNASFDGVAISQDGSTWFEIAPLRSLPSSYGGLTRVVLDPLIQRLGWNFNSTFQIRFAQFDDLAIPDDGLAIDDVAVRANPTTAIVLSIPPNIAEGTASVPFTVTLPSAPAANTTVLLSSSAAVRLTMPASVTVLAGQTTATGTASAPQNSYPDARYAAYITATASGYTTSYTYTQIVDDEHAVLSLTLPNAITEGGANGTGTATLSTPLLTATSVFFTSSTPSEATVTANATFNAGTTSATFTITSVNNTRLDGTRNITIEASGQGLTSTSASMDVLDDESTKLTLIPPTSLVERGQAKVGRVSITGLRAVPTTVMLSSSDTGEVTVPASVIIPAGQTSVNYLATPVDDSLQDGTQSVTLSASAADLISGSTSVLVRDDEPNNFSFSVIPSPQTRDALIPLIITAQDESNQSVTDFNGTVTLDTSSGITLSTSAQLSFVNGIWSGNVRLSSTGSGVTLSIAGTDGATGLSNPFDLVAGGAATALTFAPIPSPQIAGTALPVQISAVDASGVLVTAASGAVTVELLSSPANVVISTKQATLIDGSATLPSLTVPATVPAVYLRATAGALSGQTTVFAVTTPDLAALQPEPEVSVFAEDFETGGFRPEWQISGTGLHRTIISGSLAPRDNQHLLMDVHATSTSRNEATLTLDLSGLQDLTLSFWMKEFLDESHGPPTTPFTNGADFDGVAISADGVTWYEVQGLRSADAISDTYQQFTVDLSAAADTHGLVFGPGFKIRFNHYDDLQLPSDGFAFDDILITARPVAQLALTLPASLPEGSTGHAIVTLPAMRGVDTVVQLSTNRPGQLTLPASITIPAGQISSAPISLQSVEDSVLAGMQQVEVIAEAPGFRRHIGSLALVDNEATPGFDLSLSAGSLAEGGSISGTVSMTSAMQLDLSVALSAAPSIGLTFPPTLILPAGSTNQGFTLGKPENTLILEATSTLFTASSGSATDSSPLTLTDNDASAPLIITLPSSVVESAAPLTGTVGFAAPVSAGSDIIVSLVSSDSASFTVPANVTIPAGSATVDFTATPQNNALFDGTRDVTLTATASGVTQDTHSIAVTDDDLHHFTIAPISSPQAALLPISLSMSALTVDDQVITGFSSSFALTATSAGAPLSFTQTGPPTFVAGQWSPQIQFAAPAADVVLTLTSGSVSISSAVFQVAARPQLQLSTSSITRSIPSLEPQQSTTITLTNPGGIPLAWTGQILTATWLTIFPSSGTIPPGGSDIVTLTFNPAGLPVMSHAGGLRFISDDIINPQQNVAVTLNVTNAIANFLWSTLPSPQVANVPFAATVTARDSGGSTVTSYQGTARLSSLFDGSALTGSGTSANPNPFQASAFTESRMQTIYTHAELGGAGPLQNFISIQTGGSFSLSNFVLRVKHTNKGVFNGTEWESTGWTTLYSGSFNSSGAGMVQLPITPGFEYDGIRNLMVDISYNHTSASTSGSIIYTASSADRSMYAGTNDNTISPTNWQGSTPAATRVSWTPNLLFTKPITKPVTPGTITFTNGVWSGDLAAQSFLPSTAYFRAQHPTRPSIIGNSNTLTANNTGSLIVSLSVGSVREGETPFFGNVLTTATSPTPLIVNLTSSDPSEITVPATITIPAGHGGASFLATIVDDALLDGTQITTLSATAPNRSYGTRALSIQDNDATTVTVSLPPSITENTTATGQIILGTPAAADLTVTLSSSLTSRLTVGTLFTIPAGQSSISFTLNAPNNSVIDGTQSATITATLEGSAPGIGTLDVLDNESRNITLSVTSSLREWDSSAYTGNIFLAGTVSSPLVIHLTSSDTSELTVAATATINAGSSSTTFTFTAVDDALYDGSQYVTITATADTFNTTTTPNITVTDDDVHHFSISSVPSPQIARRPIILSVNAKDINNLTIPTYSGTPTISAVDGGTPLPITVHSAAAFLNGSSSVSLSIDQLTSSGVITFTDAALGITGSTNLFTVTHGTFTRYGWANIPSPQITSAPFSVTVTAQDDYGNTVPTYTGSTALSVASLHGIGSANTTFIYPLHTGSSDSRTQIIYTAAEVGGARNITSLSLNVAALPGGVMNSFTIRMKHTTRVDYSTGASWETSGWTTCHQSHAIITATGWTTFYFATPFIFSGATNLMVDISFNNTFPSLQTGVVVASDVSTQERSCFAAHNIYGDPLLWGTISSPAPISSTYRPDVRLGTTSAIAVTPATTGSFVNGVWTGNVSLPVQASLQLQAANAGLGGLSNSFTLIPPPPTITLTAPTSISESASDALATITFNTLQPVPYVINLVSSDTTAVQVPASITVPANTLSRPIALAIINDALKDGAQNVTLTASGSGISPAQASITVLDDELHNFAISSIPSPQIKNGPFTVTLTARSIDGQPILNYTGIPLLTAHASGTPLPLTTSAAVSDFIDGSKTINVTISDFATQALLTLTDGAVSSTSNPFDIQTGSPARFVWSAIPVLQIADQDIPVTVMAQDTFGNPTPSFTGSADLTAEEPRAIGDADNVSEYPLHSTFTRSRSQQVLPASKVGSAGQITSLSINIADIGVAATLTDFTIRLKHTTRTTYSGAPGDALWESSGFTTVYQGSPSISGTGLVTFPFATPFTYNGTSHLMIDYSHRGSSALGSIGPRATATADSVFRSIQHSTHDTTNGEPLTWAGTTPTAQPDGRTTDVQLGFIRALSITPASLSFSGGEWTGALRVGSAATALTLRAATPDLGTQGTSAAFEVIAFPHTFISEPAYTSGLSNTLQWVAPAPGLQYQVQRSITPDFLAPVSTNFSTPTLSLQTGLIDSQFYHYRFRMRRLTSPSWTSGWSPTVTSTQDATPPVIAAFGSITATSSSPIKGTATDASGVSLVTIGSENATTSDAYAHWIGQVNGLAPGSNTVTITAQDGAVPPNTATATGTLVRTSSDLPMAPVFHAEPQSQWTALGQTARFTPVVIGSRPMTYSWQKDGKIIRNGGAEFLIPAVKTTDVGQYSLFVMSSSGDQRSSAPFSLAVYTPPAVIGIKSGGALKFTIPTTVPKGQTVTYRWHRLGAPVSEGSRPSGAVVTGVIKNTLTITRATPSEAGTWVCRLSLTGPGITGAPVTVDVPAEARVHLYPPTLSPLPSPVEVWVSQPLDFTLNATHHPTSYAATSLPAGLILDKLTGRVSGRITTASKVDTKTSLPIPTVIKFTATNAVGTSLPIELRLIIKDHFGPLAGNFQGLADRHPITNFNLGGLGDLTLAKTGIATGSITLAGQKHSFVTPVLPLDAATGGLGIAAGDLDFRLPRTKPTALGDLSVTLTLTPTAVTGSLDDLQFALPQLLHTYDDASLESPQGIAIDSEGFLYIADSGSGLIRILSPGQPHELTTHTSTTFTAPEVVLPVTGGVLVAADSAFHALWANGTTTTYAGASGQSGHLDGSKATARFRSPSGICTDPAGNYYITDRSSHTIRKISAGIVTTLAGKADTPGHADGTGSKALFHSPRGILYEPISKTLLVADTENAVIRRVTLTGAVTTYLGSPDVPGDAPGIGINARLNRPIGIATDGRGTLFITDGGLWQISPAGIAVRLSSSITSPAGIIHDPGTGQLFITDPDSHSIQQLSLPPLTTPRTDSALTLARTPLSTSIPTGIYNASLTPASDTGIPQGHGHASLTISSKAAITFTGRLPDGQTWTAAAPLSLTRQFFTSAPLYKGTGSIHGSFTLDQAGSLGTSAPLTWLKLPQPRLPTDRSYPGGFDLQLAIAGGIYTPGNLHTYLGLSGSPAALSFQAGLFNQPITLTAPSTLKVTLPNPQTLTLAISPATGLITGKFQFGTPARSATFSGLLINDGTQRGLGHFLLPDSTAKDVPIQSGPIILDED